MYVRRVREQKKGVAGTECRVSFAFYVSMCVCSETQGRDSCELLAVGWGGRGGGGGVKDV